MHCRCLDAIIKQMKIGVRYETIYRYDRAVRFSPHDVRLFPRTDRFVQITRLDFRTQPETTVRFGRDVFDNVVASCFFDQPSEMLELRLAIDVEAAKKIPSILFCPVALSKCLSTTRKISPRSFALIANVKPDESISLPGWTPPSQESPRETVATLVELTNALHQTISYERREEGAAQSPAETLRRQRGACRDTAVLLAEMLRDLGLAARVVSGYLAGGEGSRAEGSLHAWTEVFLPGAGWIGLDPTNGIFCNDNFIPAAVGLRPADITPISGSFYHRDRIPAEMKSRLELITL